ncbi:hypothetical protein D1007_30831 [Hordeum vulgare]|nr:hypothetical protein D1007_41779 [Hordeum vulgare]KAE8794518.1 hypothetical protein D1007_30831 [Hordeum vulgare]
MPPKKKYTFPRHTITTDSSQPKQRKPMPRQAGVFGAEWRAKVTRWEAVTTDQHRRLNTKKIRDVVAAAVVDQEEASRAGMMNPPDCNQQTAWRGR